MSLIERPYHLNYSKNEIRYVWQLADLERPGLYLQVRLVYTALSSIVYDELYTFDLKPTNAGLVYLYIQNYLDSVVNYMLPNIGAVISTADDQARKFYVEYREITDEDPDPDFITTESAFIRKVIKGGVEKNKFNSNNVFANYIETQKVFLTWQPKKHFVFTDENVFLTFLNLDNIDLKLKVVTTATDGTTDTQLTNIAAGNLIYHLNVGPDILSFTGFTTKQNFYYEVSITNTAGDVVIINPFRFYMEYRNLYKKFYDLVYFNSISGVDSVRVVGETAVTITRDADETEGGLQLDRTSRVNSFEKSYTNIRLQRTYKGDIGYLRNRSKKQQESFIEILATEKIYQVIDNRWVPVINLQKSVDLGKNTDTKQSFPIEWSLSESNEVYTPADTLFGEPTDYMSIPENLVVVIITNTDSTHASIQFACDETTPAGTGYTVELTRISTGGTSNSTGPNTNMSFTGLIRGEYYSARVRAEFGGGPGDFCEPIIATIPA